MTPQFLDLGRLTTTLCRIRTANDKAEVFDALGILW